VRHPLVLVLQPAVETFAEAEHAAEPDQADQIEDDDGVELAQEVHALAVQVEPNGQILAGVAQPALERESVGRQEEVEVLHDVESPHHIPERQWQVLRPDIRMHEQQLQ